MARTRTQRAVNFARLLWNENSDPYDVEDQEAAVQEAIDNAVAPKSAEAKAELTEEYTELDVEDLIDHPAYDLLYELQDKTEIELPEASEMAKLAKKFASRKRRGLEPGATGFEGHPLEAQLWAVLRNLIAAQKLWNLHGRPAKDGKGKKAKLTKEQKRAKAKSEKATRLFKKLEQDCEYLLMAQYVAGHDVADGDVDDADDEDASLDRAARRLGTANRRERKAARVRRMRRGKTSTADEISDALELFSDRSRRRELMDDVRMSIVGGTDDDRLTDEDEDEDDESIAS